MPPGDLQLVSASLAAAAGPLTSQASALAPAADASWRSPAISASLLHAAGPPPHPGHQRAAAPAADASLAEVSSLSLLAAAAGCLTSAGASAATAQQQVPPGGLQPSQASLAAAARCSRLRGSISGATVPAASSRSASERSRAVTQPSSRRDCSLRGSIAGNSLQQLQRQILAVPGSSPPPSPEPQQVLSPPQQHRQQRLQQQMPPGGLQPVSASLRPAAGCSHLRNSIQPTAAPTSQMPPGSPAVAASLT
ncbi:hypothetical protein CYMTET_11165 [Cymbomonas tetramitiformis]|uniref:Uncharacterized protein n=1 Tax=Cymbomonas tetramitiformis TaxID=36881 RepID=A0AAE0GMQ1_9CHLO|nr:hypothetical protein CYMTET_11165 [Cymbomonas tetramitiformis]